VVENSALNEKKWKIHSKERKEPVALGVQDQVSRKKSEMGWKSPAKMTRDILGRGTNVSRRTE